MNTTSRLLFFSLTMGFFAYLFVAFRSRIPFGDSAPPANSMPSVSFQTTHLQGWHKRALSYPHPSPHSITPEDDVVELVVTTNSMLRPLGISLVIFRSNIITSSEDPDRVESYSYIVVDALGRVSMLPSTSSDINGILSLGRLVAREFPIPETWRPQIEVSCLPQFNVEIGFDKDVEGREIGSRETKVIRIDGYPGQDRMKVRNTGHEYLPDAVRDLFLLVLEGDEWDIDRVDQVVIEKVQKATGYSLNW